MSGRAPQANEARHPVSARGRPESKSRRRLPAGRPARPVLRLSLQFADTSHRALLARHRVQRWLRASLEAPAELTVRIVGADEGQALNRQFRRRDYATNVLTFHYQQRPVVLADLVLCAPVVEREAREQGIDLAAHYAHLLVHGALHAQGMDHQRRGEAKAMQAREAQVLAVLGFADPYAR